MRGTRGSAYLRETEPLDPFRTTVGSLALASLHLHLRPLDTRSFPSLAPFPPSDYMLLIHFNQLIERVMIRVLMRVCEGR